MLGEKMLCNKQTLLDFIKKYRHDWLNEIQIVKGYLTLGKVDDAQKHMEQIIFKALDESRISQIGDPDLAYELITYNWRQDMVKLHYEIELEEGQDLRSISKRFPPLHEWVKEVLEIVQRVCYKDTENHLFMCFDVKAQDLLLTIELDGESNVMEAKDALNELRNKFKKNQGTLHIETIDQNEWNTKIFIPEENFHV